MFRDIIAKIKRPKGIGGDIRTVFSMTYSVHNKLVSKYKWYDSWHQKPYASKVHYSILSISILCFLIGSALLILPLNWGKFAVKNGKHKVTLYAAAADSGQQNFGANLTPEFILNSDGLIKPKESKVSKGQMDIAGTKIVASISKQNKKADIQPEISVIEGADDKVTIKVSQAYFSPGKYQLRVYFQSGSENYYLTQDFTWGVLAINLDKQPYLSNEEAFLAMGVLDDNGKMVCDADAVLSIQKPSGEVDILSTKDKTISISDQCAVYGDTKLPDYSAKYKVGQAGTYNLKLTATTKNGTREISDKLIVQDGSDFYISREAPTRIYPPSSYSVKITTKASISFPGPVREFIPAIFTIIDPGGATVTETGDNKILVWDFDFQAGEEKTFTYTFKAPPESPEFYLLGPVKIGPVVDANGQPTQSDHTYKELRQWQIASDTPDGTGMLVYDEDGANSPSPHYRTWNGTDLSAEGNTGADETVTDEVNHTIIEASPTRDEYIRGALTTAGHLDVQVLYSNGDWTNGSNAPTNGDFTTGIGTTNDVYRAFDISYEETTGNAMVVYESTSTANKTIMYRTWDGTNWSAEQTLDYSAVAEGGATDVTVWVELEGDYGSNNILLGWQDKTGLGFYGARWDGTQWLNIALISGAGVISTKQGFDVAWEGTSGKGKMVYATGTTLGAATYTPGSGWAADTVTSPIAVAVQWVRIAGSPNNNYIAVMADAVASTTSADMYVDMWNGTNWTGVGTITGDSDINNNGYAQPMDVAWEKAASADRALFVWRDGTTSELALRYMVYDISAGAYQAINDSGICVDSATHNVTDLSSTEALVGPCSGLGAWPDQVSGVKLTSDPGSRKIMVLAEDMTADLAPEAQLWNGTDAGTWLTQTANMGAIEADLSTGASLTTSLPTKPYDFAFRRSETATGISISGNIYTSAAGEATADNTAYTLKISVNNAAGVAATVPGNGTYTASGITAASGNSIAVYIEGSANDANAFTITDGSTAITGLNLIVGKATVGSNNGSTATTNTNICNQAIYPAAGDTLISCSGTNLTTASNAEFHVLTGMGNKYDTNSGTLTTQGTGSLHIDDSAIATLTSATVITGSVAIDASATLVAASTNTVSVAGDWTNAGTFTANSSAVTFNGSAAQSVTCGSSGFNNFTVTNSAGPTIGVTFADSCTISGTFTDITASSKIIFHSTSTYAFNAISINGGAIGTRVVLTSSTGASVWNLNITAASPIASYVDVKDSNANKDIDATTGGFDSTGNTHWLFPSTNTAPTNDSLTFTNPYSTNVAVADNTTNWNFQALVTDLDGSTDINYVEIHFANSTDSTQPYDSLKYRWTRSSNTFSEVADTQNAGTIDATSSANAVGTQWTINFKIKLNSSFATTSTNYATELYSIDNAAATDTDNYTNIYQVTPLSLSLDVDNASLSFGSLLPGSIVTGTTISTVTTNYPNGYTLGASDGIASTNSALVHTDTTTRIADYAGTIASPTTWTGTGLGICVWAATGKIQLSGAPAFRKLTQLINTPACRWRRPLFTPKLARRPRAIIPQSATN